MVSAGMLIAGDDIPVSYDRFRHRVMFPITDLKGRVIAFGGRALDADAPAKYLNSPETPLFHKGHVLFNAANARTAAFDKHQIIVVEGYMDVIALSEAGFPQTVAPLGTALTEDQIKLLWRLAPEPVLCFDGDAAGRRAAFRAVETVLPHLKPGFSVQFAFLPEGLDPDDLVRQQGAAAFGEAFLTKVRPLVDVLWEREQSGRPTNTPERRAAFQHRVEQLVLQIRDTNIQALYRREFKDRFWKFWREKGKQNPDIAHTKISQSPSPRDEPLLMAIIAHPWLLDEFIDDIIRFDFSTEIYSQLLSFILEIHAKHDEQHRFSLEGLLRESHFAPIIERLSSKSGHKAVSFVRPELCARHCATRFLSFPRELAPPPTGAGT